MTGLRHCSITSTVLFPTHKSKHLRNLRINVTWSLGAAVLVSVAGRLSDIFGRRYFMLCGASISFIGTIIGATGQSIPQMILSGILFGIGSGFQELGFACIMEFIPNRYRLTALGKMSASFHYDAGCLHG